jgi:hypothetical protein
LDAPGFPKDPAELDSRPPEPGREPIREVIELRQMRVVFQPIVEVESGEVFAYEALVRPTAHFKDPPSLFEAAVASRCCGEFGMVIRHVPGDRSRLRLPVSRANQVVQGSGLWSQGEVVPASEIQDSGGHCIWRGESLRNPSSSGSTSELVIVEVEGHVEPGHAVGTTHMIASFQGASGSGLMRMQSAAGTEYMSGVPIAPEDVAAAFGLPFTPRPRWLSTSVLIIALPVAMLVIGSAIGLVWCR